MASSKGSNAFLIAGGGIAGLSTAIALAREGQDVEVLEREEAFSKEGAGIQLGPNATRILNTWGVLDHLMPHAVRAEGIGMGHGLTGDPIARVPLGDLAEERYGAPYLLVRRADLHQALLETARALPTVSIETGWPIHSFEQFGEDIVVRTDAHARRGRALIAADGLWSGLRTQVCDTAGMIYTERTAWRATLEPDKLPEELQGPWTGLWMAPNAHLVHYPVAAGNAVNVVAVITERWTAGEGWGEEIDPEFLFPHYAKWDARLRQLLEDAEGWRRWLLHDVPPLRRWTLGTVTLIGDAAHPMLPFLAQGGAMAIEDAVFLARLVAEGHRDLIETFHLFENARIARTARMRYESRKMGQIYHMKGLSALTRDFVLRRRAPEALLKRFDWLYGFDAFEARLA